MALLIREIFKIHDDVLEKYRDTRLDDWFLMNSFWQTGIIIVLYLYFVLGWGPKWMEKRKPFNLDRILLVYNALQVLTSFSMFILCTIYLVPYYNFRCEPVDYSNSFRGVTAAKLGWCYFFTKVLDLLDTVFFVLRKKRNQITFLHVFHHTGMVALTWSGTRFFAGGVSLYMGYVNTIVHVFMYSYYLLSVWNKDLSRNIWLKKQITHLQLLQFCLVSISFAVVLLTEDCGYPKWICMILFPQNAFLFYLFADFYYKAYIRKSVAKNTTAKTD